MIYICTFFLAFLLSIFLSPVTIKASERWNIFSKPKKEAGPMPCLGGLGIFIAVVAGCVLARFLYSVDIPRLIGLIVSSSLIVLLGVIDDVEDLRPFVKIIAQMIAIGLLMLFGFHTKIAFLPVWANLVITFIWIIFITNAFNLLDIVDGLTSGLVIIISLPLLVISLVNKDALSSIVLISLIGANLGFLRYNYPPARLYMGDTGSLFSGFLLATVAINISYASFEKPIALITPILAMSLPIYDTLFVIVMRAKKGRAIFSKTDDHFALRLVTMGYSVHKGLWIMYLFAIFLSIAALIVVFGSTMMGIIALAVVVLTFIFLGKKVGMVKV